MEKAIYSLVVMMFSRMLAGWGKGFYSKFKMYRQLKAEVKFLHQNISANRERIEKDTDDNNFPLIKRLEMPIHDKLISDFILDEEVSLLAVQLIGNCRHYNRIIKIGEKDKDKKKRKSEVLHQGALIFNNPTLIYEVKGEFKKSYVSQTEKYLGFLDARIGKYRKILKCFPWYLVLFYFDENEGAET